MESEHEQFSASQSDADGTGNQDTAAQPSSQAASAGQEIPADEHASSETPAAARRRRWRPSRSSARRSAAAEEHPEETMQDETQHTQTEMDQEQQHAQEATEPTLAASAWAPAPYMAQEVNGWTEQVIRSATGEEAAASDLAQEATAGAPVEMPLPLDAEMFAPAPAAEPQPTAPAAEEMTNQEPYEPLRAPLSGVEVRPARRYRFDRPASAAREARDAAPQPKAATQPAGGASPARQLAPQMKHAEKAPPTEHRGTPARPTTAAAAKEQEMSAAIERELTETPEVEAEVEAAEDLALATKVALEEEMGEALETFVPPETQVASTRSNRRRRRRSPSSSTQAAPAEPPAAHAPASPAAPQGPSNTNQLAPIPPAALGQNYQVNNGLQQMNQPQSPFAGPEPSSARGFGPVPHGVARPAERSVRLPRTDRAIDSSSATMNQLASLFTQAMQQQTDRLLTELRRSQGTPSMTVNFPPMPSTERVGVFVDVANLLYSARNMRLAIDFGRLLDFLRGNRRLIRAHAYCPTSPDPRAEQMFLDAVKGLGYRITTKNYKTFSSGAKKADLDLDMCMDIVRLVDANSVDCISLVSGDSDFLPLLEYCSDHGVRVEVAAFDEATAGILRQSCDLFINLSLVEEIRA